MTSYSSQILKNEIISIGFAFCTKIINIQVGKHFSTFCKYIHHVLTFCQQMQVSNRLTQLTLSLCNRGTVTFLLLFFSVANNFQINVSLLISEQSLVLSCVDVLHIAITCLHCKYLGTLHTVKLKYGFHNKSFILTAPLKSVNLR